MTLTPDAPNDMTMLLACLALADSDVTVRLFANHELMYFGEIIEADLLSGTVTIDDAETHTVIKPSEFNRIEIY